ncbi:MAG TPA: hypothetical protein PKA55_10245 [Rhodoblastus sp.]|nr:hypothetical protein [Rhodoblastus sp.]
MKRKSAIALSLFGLLIATQPGAAAAGPFTGYQGNWSGSGSISTGEGAERIRCRASYAVDGTGNSLTQRITCASDSYRFVVVSDVIANGSSISGSWSETTRALNGSLSGSVSNGRYNAHIAGSGFTANVSVASSPSRQTVTITSGNSGVRRVSMSLQKGG